MTKQLVLKQVIIAFYLLFSFSSAFAAENFSTKLMQAYQAKQPMPHISANLSDPSAITEEAAYQVQKAYVSLRQKADPIAGYKAGLTSTAGQKKFKVSQALSGVLFTSGNVADPKKIRLSDAQKLMIETEIGFILSKPITSPIKDKQQLAKFVESVVAVIELPDLGYEQPQKIKGIDLIAANLASHQYIMATPIPLSQLSDINLITTQLSHLPASLNGTPEDPQVLLTGQANDALGDQWIALQWLINHLLQQGYQLSAGNLLITGALGKMIPAQLGEYNATFGELGRIQFTLN